MRSEWIGTQAAPDQGALNGLIGMSRRGFLKATGAVGGGLVLGFVVPGAGRLALAQPDKPVSTPNAFLQIAPDNTMTASVNRLEFGQGVHSCRPAMHQPGWGTRTSASGAGLCQRRRKVERQAFAQATF